MANSSSSSTVDGELTLTIPEGGYVNLRLLAASDPSWKWSSSSTGAAVTAAASATNPAGNTPQAFTSTGDVDIWLAAGKSIIVKIDPGATA